MPTNQEIADQTYNKIMIRLESMEKDADRMDKRLEKILETVKQNNKDLQEVK